MPGKRTHDTLTLVGTCQDTVRALRAERRAKPGELKPRLENVDSYAN